MNRWNIPQDMEERIQHRDTECIYCRRPFSGLDGPRGQRRSWEHIINDETLISYENIALCCISCNASKGAKGLSSWLGSRYCSLRGIGADTIAPVAFSALCAGSEPQTRT